MIRAIRLRPLPSSDQHNPQLGSEVRLQAYAKNPTAPVGPKTDVIRGKTRVRIPAKNRLTATDRLIPTSDFN